MRKISKTAIGVGVFVALLIAAGYSMKANATENQFHIGVGKTVINSHLKVGEVGYIHNNWDFEVSLMEAGDTKRGYQDNEVMYSVSYITEPSWGIYGIDPYFKLGVSANSGHTLVGDTNFRLGVGLDFHDVWRIEYVHHSSAGIHDPNTGVDYVKIDYLIDPFW
ncbi:MAG: hypothetical protein CMF22_10590 [Idiomarinaceae bacterium]|nr:hypothetical protein [Idiomarinaceae bacterium]MBG23888.1 hypothetical protein [Idiomarinaceae bacterium]|tara:strand:+ start:12109 stop:12600 length:492 start_codon:yes stop_codon:yes gene_type:complete